MATHAEGSIAIPPLRMVLFAGFMLLAGCSGNSDNVTPDGVSNDPPQDDSANLDTANLPDTAVSAQGPVENPVTSPATNAGANSGPAPETNAGTSAGPVPEANSETSAGSAPEANPGPSEHSINKPRSLRAVAYTFNEVELFWSNPENSTAVAWNVARDGEQVATVEGPSFYEAGLQELTEYRYTVTPVDDQKNPGDASEVVVSTPANLPIITLDNAHELAFYSMQQFSLEPMVPLLAALHDSYYALFPSVPHEGTVNCPDGGSASATRQPFEYGRTAGGVALTFKRCGIRGSVWDGSVSLSQQSFARQRGSEREDASCTLDFQSLDYQSTGSTPYLVDGTLTSTGDLYHGTAFRGRLVNRLEAGSTILDADFVVRNSAWRWINGTFRLQSQLTGNRPLQVAVTKEIRVSTDQRFDNQFREGVITITDPDGGTITNTNQWRNDNQQWVLQTNTTLGHNETLHEEKAGDDLPALDQWPAGTACQLLYPPGGLLISETGAEPQSDSDDPFSSDQLLRTLDTVFAVQQGLWINQGFSDTLNIARQAETAGGAVTEVPSSQATLLDEDLGTTVQVDPDTGERQTVTYVNFSVDESVVDCPLGGTATRAVKYAGSYVYRAAVADQCVLGDKRTSSEYNGYWVKYGGDRNLKSYSSTGPDTSLQISSATTSSSSAFYIQTLGAESVVHQATDGRVTAVDDFQATYSDSWDTGPGATGDRPASRVSASVNIDNGNAMFRLESDGDLHFISDIDVRLQGHLVLTASDNSTLRIISGNGDNESFDVEVQSSNGYGYTRRLPYTDEHYLRIR